MEQIEPVETKICRACGKPKMIRRFPTLKSGNKGNVCNLCKSMGRTIKKLGESSSKPVPKNIALNLGNTSKKDYIETYKFLESIGYDLKQDIHVQFCEKHGFTPKIPKKQFLNHYTQEDCGLI